MISRAYIFDMDGVLIDSEPLHYEADQIVLKELGISVEDSYLDKFVGYTNPAMWEIIQRDFSLKSSIDDIMERQVSLKVELLNKRDYQPIEGISELMKGIKGKNIPIGLASSSPRILIEAIIAKLGLQSYIDTWESGEEVEHSKPAPDIFLHVARLLNVEPEFCTVIEDSRSGVTAAKTAGMECIGFHNPNSGNQDLREADLIVDNIGDIKC